MKLIIVLLSLLALNNSYAKEMRQRIVVIDTGLNVVTKILPYLCEDAIYGIDSEDGTDPHGHGTNIVGIISKGMNNKKQCITMIKVPLITINGATSYNSLAYIKALEKAVTLEPHLLNLSVAGGSKSMEEETAIKTMLKNYTTIVIAAGNNSERLDKHCDLYPQCMKEIYPQIHLVGALTNSKLKLSSSNYGKLVTEWEVGEDVEGLGISLTGTSQAAAVKSQKLLKEDN